MSFVGVLVYQPTSKKTKIINNFENNLQTSLSVKVWNYEELCALLTCFFSFPGEFEINSPISKRDQSCCTKTQSLQTYFINTWLIDWLFWNFAPIGICNFCEAQKGKSFHRFLQSFVRPTWEQNYLKLWESLWKQKNYLHDQNKFKFHAWELL